MLKIALFIVLLALSSNTFSQANIELIYSDLKLSLPNNFMLIGALGDMGGQENILIFRYGNEKGKRYIALSDMTNDTSVEYGCSIGLFYNELFSDNKNTDCNNENLNIMRKVFIENKEIAVWAVNGYVLNYSAGKGKSFVFISGENGKLIGVESDFIDKRTYKNIFKNI